MTRIKSSTTYTLSENVENLLLTGTSNISGFGNTLNNEIVGNGFSGPPNDDVSDRKCDLHLVASHKPKSDRTCCVHAEWRAIIDALKNKKDISGSTLYFTRVDAEGNLLKSGEPYCTACSRLMFDTGVSQVALWHSSVIQLYDTKKFNDISY